MNARIGVCRSKEFQSILDCHAYWGRDTRPVDVLNLFREMHAVGRTRLKVCDICLREAWKDGLMPHDAQAVHEGLFVKFRSVVSDSAMQRQGRVEKAFDDLSTGHLS